MPDMADATPGAVSNNMRESDIVLEVAQRMAANLEHEHEVMLSRIDDTFVSINDRWRAANAWRADYFISVHTNAGGGHGAETFFAATKPNDRGFAAFVNDSFAIVMDLRNRGVKPDTQSAVGSLGVLRHTTMPAILIELAFIDAPHNTPDAFLLRKRRADMAQAISDAVNGYFIAKEVSEVRYRTILDMPSWMKRKIRPLLDAGVIQGTGATENGEVIINLSEDMVRVMIANLRTIRAVNEGRL